MLERESKRKKLVNKYSEKRANLLSELKKVNSLEEKFIINEKIQKLPRNSSSIRLRNRCWMTGRSRGYYRDFGLSRHVLRELVSQCLVPGVRKASW